MLHKNNVLNVNIAFLKTCFHISYIFTQLMYKIIHIVYRSRNSAGNPSSIWQEAALRGKARDSCSSR